MEKYGTLEISKEYLDKNQLEDWIQLFLRNDGHNVALADGLLKEERCYTGIVDFDLNLLENIKAGAPEYLIRENDIEYFFAIVNEMNKASDSWNSPPLIIEYRADGSFYVCDGRHRLLPNGRAVRRPPFPPHLLRREIPLRRHTQGRTS